MLTGFLPGILGLTEVAVGDTLSDRISYPLTGFLPGILGLTEVTVRLDSFLQKWPSPYRACVDCLSARNISAEKLFLPEKAVC